MLGKNVHTKVNPYNFASSPPIPLILFLEIGNFFTGPKKPHIYQKLVPHLTEKHCSNMGKNILYVTYIIKTLKQTLKLDGPRHFNLLF